MDGCLYRWLHAVCKLIMCFAHCQQLEEAGNAVVKEMLQTLAVLQQRAKEKDPVNYKKKERFVMGLRQVRDFKTFCGSDWGDTCYCRRLTQSSRIDVGCCC